MKVIIIAVTLIAFTASEPPPSKSYLPPPSSRSSLQSGYPRGQGNPPFNGIPEVVAARSLKGHGQETNGNGFARNANHDYEANTRFGGNGVYGHDHNDFVKNPSVDVSEPPNYNFGYAVNDYREGNDFGHHEERLQESAHGQYHVVLPDGRRQTVSYQADSRGFEPRVSYHDADEGNSGYDSNANTRSGIHDNGFGYNRANNGY